MSKSQHIFFGWLPLIAAFGCLEPTNDRTEREQTIGTEQGGEWGVSVRNGLAAVRELTDDSLLLWQSAPAIDVEFEVRASGTREISVLNTMPDAELAELTGPIAGWASELERISPTRVTFQANFTEPGTYRASLRLPDASDLRPFRFALMSDVQEAIDDVQDLYRAMNTDSEIEFLLGAGDLTEQGSFEELRRFESELEGLNLPYYTTLGNHELGSGAPPFQELYGRGNFSFEYRGVRFTLLDSASATLDLKVYEWLDGWLQQGRDSFHIVAMHVPPVDPIGTRNGSFASRAEANKLLGRLLSGGVDLTLYGHVHSFYSYTNGGIPAFIAGGGGAIPERFDGIGRHFMIIDVDPGTQTFDYDVVEVD